MPSPFDTYDFANQSAGAVPGVSNDDILRVLNKGNPSSFGQMADTSGGIDRVNQNTGNTGTVAYRDNKGQAVLTNVARDPITNQDKQIPALFKSIPSETQTQNLPQKPDTPLNLFEQLNKLRVTKDATVAQGLWSSLQETLTSERARIEKEAFTFAENKLGIPVLQKQLDDARQLDRADPKFIPGMGDSPITQKVNAQLLQARGFADNEAKNYLTQNTTYRSLLTTEKTAEAEYKRIQTIADRQDQITLSHQLSQDNADVQARLQHKLREEDRIAAFNQVMTEKYDGLSSQQIARINLLHSADLAAFSDITDEAKRKVKIMSLVLGNKDKKYQEAINAEGNPQLLNLALGGNQYARKIVVANEAASMGVPATQIEDQLTALQREMADPAMPIRVLRSRKGMKPEEANKLAGDINAGASQFNLDPNKKLEATQQRVTLLMEWAQGRKTQEFLNDTRSWNATDPVLLSAIDKSVKTTGKADVQNVLSAYVGDSTDTERLTRLEEFRKAIRNAAARHENSVFGMPDYRQAEALVVNEMVNKGFFHNMWQKIQQADAKASAAIGLKENTRDGYTKNVFGPMAPGILMDNAVGAPLTDFFFGPQNNQGVNK